MTVQFFIPRKQVMSEKFNILKCLVSEYSLIQFVKLLRKDGNLEIYDKNIYHENAIQNRKALLNNYKNPQNE